MPERVRLTDSLVLAWQPRPREYAVHDFALPGSGIRVQPRGARVWILRFRRSGRPRRITLGSTATFAGAAACGAAALLRPQITLPMRPSGCRKFGPHLVFKRSY